MRVQINHYSKCFQVMKQGKPFFPYTKYFIKLKSHIFVGFFCQAMYYKLANLFCVSQLEIILIKTM